MVKCTVIVAQYNSEQDKIIRTIKSIISQKNVVVQIIIADDASDEDYITSTIDYMKKNNFDNYTVSKNRKNVGTVTNVYNATQKAKYEYLAFLSPGDYFYDDVTLHETISRMEKESLQFLFGKVAPYHIEDGRIQLVDKQQPHCLFPYIEFEKKKKYSHIKKTLVVYRDYIAGASFYWKKDVFSKYIERIVSRVRYMEDLITSFAVLDEIKMGFSNRYVVWYEYGEGVSTSHSAKWTQRMNSDTDNFYKILLDIYPNNKYVKRANIIQSICTANNMKSKVLQCFICPDRVLFILLHYKLKREKIIPANTKFIEEIYGEQ